MTHRANGVAASRAVIGGVELEGNFQIATIESFPPGFSTMRLYASAMGSAHGSVNDDPHSADPIRKAINGMNAELQKYISFLGKDEEDIRGHRLALLSVWLNDEPIIFPKRRDSDFSEYHLICDKEGVTAPAPGTRLQMIAWHYNKSAIEKRGSFQVFLEPTGEIGE